MIPVGRASKGQEMTVRQTTEESQAPRRPYQRPSLVRGPVLANIAAQTVSGAVPSDR
jgi:hypothetical protein